MSPIWTDDEAAYDRPPPGYVRCANATPQQVEGDALIRAWLCFAFAVAEVARVVVDVNAPWPAAEDIWEHGGAWHVVLGTYEDEHGRVCVAFTDHTTALAGRMLCDRSWTRVHPVTDADAA